MQKPQQLVLSLKIENNKPGEVLETLPRKKHVKIVDHLVDVVKDDMNKQFTGEQKELPYTFKDDILNGGKSDETDDPRATFNAAVIGTIIFYGCFEHLAAIKDILKHTDTDAKVVKQHQYLYVTNELLHRNHAHTFKDIIHELLHAKDFNNAKQIARSYKQQSDPNVQKERLAVLIYLQFLAVKLLHVKDESYADTKSILMRIRELRGDENLYGYKIQEWIDIILRRRLRFIENNGIDKALNNYFEAHRLRLVQRDSMLPDQPNMPEIFEQFKYSIQVLIDNEETHRQENMQLEFLAANKPLVKSIIGNNPQPLTDRLSKLFTRLVKTITPTHEPSQQKLIRTMRLLSLCIQIGGRCDIVNECEGILTRWGGRLSLVGKAFKLLGVSYSIVNEQSRNKVTIMFKNFLKNKLPHILSYCRDKGTFPFHAYSEILKGIVFLKNGDEQVVRQVMGAADRKEPIVDDVTRIADYDFQFKHSRAIFNFFYGLCAQYPDRIEMWKKVVTESPNDYTRNSAALAITLNTKQDDMKPLLTFNDPITTIIAAQAQCVPWRQLWDLLEQELYKEVINITAPVEYAKVVKARVESELFESRAIIVNAVSLLCNTREQRDQLLPLIEDWSIRTYNVWRNLIKDEKKRSILTESVRKYMQKCSHSVDQLLYKISFEPKLDKETEIVTVQQLQQITRILSNLEFTKTDSSMRQDDVVTKIPPMTIPEQEIPSDPVGMSKSVFWLWISKFWIFSDNVEQIVSLMFKGLQSSNIVVVNIAHELFLHFFKEEHTMRHQLIPYYMKLVVENSTKKKNHLYSQFLSKFDKLVTMLLDLKSTTAKPSEKDLQVVWFMITTMQRAILDELSRKKPALRSTDQKPFQLEGMLKALIQCSQLVPLSMLDNLFHSIKSVYQALPNEQRYYKLLYDILSNSLDYTRKQRCVNFYLSMAEYQTT